MKKGKYRTGTRNRRTKNISNAPVMVLETKLRINMSRLQLVTVVVVHV